MPQLNAHVFFDGTCADAMRFYERALGGKLEVLMTHGESPMAAQIPPGSADRVLHPRLVFEGGVLMGADSMGSVPYEGMKGFSLAMVFPKASDARRVFDDLAMGGTVTMPLEKTFWAEAFGMLVDRFGTPWMINGEMAST